MRSGYINIIDIVFGNASARGYNWSSLATSKLYDSAVAPGAYRLNFNINVVNPSAGPYERWNGFPLRCLEKAKRGQLTAFGKNPPLLAKIKRDQLTAFRKKYTIAITTKIPDFCKH